MKKSKNKTIGLVANIITAILLIIILFSSYSLARSIYLTLIYEKLDVISSGYIAGQLLFIILMLIVIIIARKLKSKFSS